MKHAKHQENRFLELTDDTILEILYRVPIKSLGRCKTVCKSWLSLISDPNFISSHLEFSKTNHLPLTLVSQKHNIISYLVYSDSTNITKGVTILPLDRKFICDDALEGYYFIVGSCDGLICVYFKDKNKYYDDSMYVWNPIIDKEVEISLPIDHYASFYVHIDSCWFGFVPSLDDYKIFLVFTVYKPFYGTRMHLYSFKYSEWREIHYSDEIVEIISESKCVFMNEALHYIIGREWMIKFDLVKGCFDKKIFFSIKADQKILFFGAIKVYDRLCTMFIDFSEEYWMFELWTLEEYNNWNSWEKQYTINLPEDAVKNCIDFFGFTYHGELCMQIGDGGLMLIDPRHDPPSYVIARNPSQEKVYKVMDHVESLISPDSIP